MTFGLSAASLATLQGVHPDLIAVVKHAIQITPVDFRVINGLRTEAQEAHCVATGKSQTMRSRHLDGHAVDIVALPENKVSWDFYFYAQIAEAFRSAAIDLKVPVVWGGCWGELNTIPGDLTAAVSAYRESRAAQGRSAFEDSGHFELSWTAYP